MSNYILGQTPASPEGEGGKPANGGARRYYLPEGLPIPLAQPAELYGPYWEGTRAEKLIVQRNPATGVYQWPPQWIAHDTQTFDLEWVEVAPKGVIYSWTRIWHPVHPALKDAGPYLVVVVEIAHAGRIRMLGNLLGDPMQDVAIGAEVEAVFEHHDEAQPPFTLVQWRTVAPQP
ncbi:OB-fold domain-containing protein [Sphingopyxis granuli]|uniref:Zn-ribbon domain-containing OB-fold protein n=1 Tax=Sphingopyxis granuli TaxID=267128 RepID=UPI001F531A38|nr:OB-fold domain-containing protein [Sphingopyxis granuli]UNK79179.1 OB-fold domain-containing protein [Sphingopyxis granuli]